MSGFKKLIALLDSAALQHLPAELAIAYHCLPVLFSVLQELFSDKLLGDVRQR